MDLLLRNQVAIVTGGASGIGAATSRLLAQEGTQVVVADIQDEVGHTVAAEITSGGGQAIYQHTDVSKSQDVCRLVDQAIEAFGTVDILCNIAGIGWQANNWPHIAPQDWERQYQVHMIGTFLCTQEVAHRIMIPKRKGKIVNIGSLSAHGWRGISPYSAAKAAVVGFTRNAAIELGPHGINVNVVCPGNVITPMTGGLADPASEFHHKVKDATLLKTVGDALSIAPIVVFLCSDQARYISGADINASAGQVMY